MKDKELIIHHDYTNNINLSLFSVLQVILQNLMPYKDSFDDVVEMHYKVKNTFEDFIPSMKYEKELQYFISFKGIFGVLIRSKKNVRYSCFKFRRKQQEFNAYKLTNRSSMFHKCKQVQIVLKLFLRIITSKKWFSTKEFMFDPAGFMNLSTLKDGYDSRTNHL